MGFLRLVLACLVLVSHLGISIAGYNPGVVAVIVFYLLAGQVVGKLWSRRPQHEGAWGACRWFYQDRLWRILPLYLLTLVLAALLWWSGAASPFLHKAPALGDWIANLSILPLNYYMYSGQDAFTLIPPAWSLAVELQVYLLMPLLLGRRWLGIAASAISVLIFIAAQWGWLNTDIFGYRLLLGVLFVFLAGDLFNRAGAWAKVLLALLWTMALAYALFLLSSGIHRPYDVEVALGLTFGIPLIAWLLAYPPRGIWHLWQQRLGSLTYGVFLLHFPALWFLQLLLHDRPSVWMVMGISLLWAALAHHVFEQPLWQRFRPAPMRL